MIIHHGTVRIDALEEVRWIGYTLFSDGVYRAYLRTPDDYHDSRAQTRHEMCMDTFHRGHGLFKPLTVKDDYDDTGIRWKPEAW